MAAESFRVKTEQMLARYLLSKEPGQADLRALYASGKVPKGNPSYDAAIEALAIRLIERTVSRREVALIVQQNLRQVASELVQEHGFPVAH